MKNCIVCMRSPHSEFISTSLASSVKLDRILITFLRNFTTINLSALQNLWQISLIKEQQFCKTFQWKFGKSHSNTMRLRNKTLEQYCTPATSVYYLPFHPQVFHQQDHILVHCSHQYFGLSTTIPELFFVQLIEQAWHPLPNPGTHPFLLGQISFLWMTKRCS